MDASLPVLPIILAIIVAADAVACLIPLDVITRALDEVNCPQYLRTVIPWLKFAAAAGLIIGLWVPRVGATAATALVAYFVLAWVFHFRVRHPLKEYIPAGLFLIASAAALTLSFLPALP